MFFQPRFRGSYGLTFGFALGFIVDGGRWQLLLGILVNLVLSAALNLMTFIAIHSGI